MSSQCNYPTSGSAQVAPTKANFLWRAICHGCLILNHLIRSTAALPIPVITGKLLDPFHWSSLLVGSNPAGVLKISWKAKNFTSVSGDAEEWRDITESCNASEKHFGPRSEDAKWRHQSWCTLVYCRSYIPTKVPFHTRSRELLSPPVQ